MFISFDGDWNRSNRDISCRFNRIGGDIPKAHLNCAITYVRIEQPTSQLSCGGFKYESRSKSRVVHTQGSPRIHQVKCKSIKSSCRIRPSKKCPQ